MAKIKPATLKGTRDIDSDTMLKRNFIFDTVKHVFKKFGFLQIETPSMEKLETLTGKYGEEGDQLIFKILNSGEKVKKADIDALNNGNLPKFANSLSEKALRYDLTVPFARYVSKNHGLLAMPFKRFQIQPVWRADRPSKGRYQEFFQCDADVVGTESLLCEAEIILMISEVFETLNITDYTIKINNRKILTALAEVMNCNDNSSDLFVVIDKLDKVPFDQVADVLLSKDFTKEQVTLLEQFINSKTIEDVRTHLDSNEIGTSGISEINTVLDYLSQYGFDSKNLEFDPKLARGLSYYTGCIFEVKVNNVSIGSVSGGGRYDNLTGVFGLDGMPGVGFSFGVDRIFDVMEELKIFPTFESETTQIMITNFDSDCFKQALPLLNMLRSNNIKAEIFPDSVKMKKQFNYADKKGISYVLIAGEDEFESGTFSLKNMITGEQTQLTIDKVIETINS